MIHKYDPEHFISHLIFLFPVGEHAPDPSRAYKAVCGVYKFLKKIGAPPPPLVNSWIRHWGYIVVKIALCAWLSNMWPVYLHSMLKS